MTPLAQHLLNDWCSPKKNRRVEDPHNVLRLLTEAKCFETSELGPAVKEMEKGFARCEEIRESGRLFLPAPVTFLEQAIPNGRLGCLLREVAVRGTSAEGKWIEIFITSSNAQTIEKFALLATSETILNGEEMAIFPTDPPQTDLFFLSGIASQLYLINTPNLLGRVTHLPHAGLQKKIARQMGMTGKFPLLAWTEITLWIDPTGANAEAENAAAEARLSGQKCLHFVRSFLRWRLGKLERVKAHVRGDASIGIKRSRYIAKERPVMRPYP